MLATIDDTVHVSGALVPASRGQILQDRKSKRDYLMAARARRFTFQPGMSTDAIPAGGWSRSLTL